MQHLVAYILIAVVGLVLVYISYLICKWSDRDDRYDDPWE